MSLVVAISAAVDGFFQFGQRPSIRRPYASADGSHADAFRTFATRVEKLIQKEVDAHITEVATEKHRSSGSG